MVAEVLQALQTATPRPSEAVQSAVLKCACFDFLLGVPLPSFLFQ